jgi:23S rRNA (cytosine1962-C5)-methyltransferase
MTKIFLKKKTNPRIENGHPWIFGNEIMDMEADVSGGETVDVFAADKKFIGRGYINPKSQIRVRLLTRNKEEKIDESFFRKRIREAWEYRKRIGYIENCRLVFGEADQLPALIVDKFNDYLVLQTLSLGMDNWKPVIVKILKEFLQPKGIYERNDAPVRELEGLDQQKGFLSDPFETSILINENGLRFHVDLENGQKTGYFLDQHENRKAIQHIVKDADVLGAFSYTGSFEIHAGYYGARSVLGLDSSEQAVDLAVRNAELNQLGKIVRFEAINAFDALKKWSGEGRKYDVVMLDPPAFAKSRENIEHAISGYKEINLRAIKLLNKGGFLVSSSCTNLVPAELFLHIIQEAARDARRTLKQVCFLSQAPDHPVLWGVENTNYLKFLVAQVGP